MSKRNKNEVYRGDPLSYSWTWNKSVVNRPKTKGVYINGVKVSSNIGDQDDYDARKSSASTAAREKKNGSNIVGAIYKNIPGLNKPAGQSHDYGVGVGAKPQKTAASAADLIQGLFSNLFGKKQALPAEQPTIAQKPKAVINNPLNTAKEGAGVGIAPSQNKGNREPKSTGNIADYMALAQKADFTDNITPGDGNLSSTYLGTRYRYINDLQGMRDGVNGTRDSALDLVVGAMGGADVALARQGMGQLYGNQYRLYDQMTQDEVDVLNYTVATRGESEAKKFLELLEPTLTERQAAETDQVASDLADTPVLGSIASVPLNAAAAMEGGITMLAGLGGQELSQNDTYRSATRAAAGIRDEISGKMTPVGSFFYQTGMSMLDTAFRLPFGGGGLAIAGLSSASQTAQQSIEDGATTEQALWLAGVSGSLEVVTEKLSLDNLINAKAAGTLSGVIKAALIQGGIEASEETASAVGNLIADGIIRKGDSAWNRELEGYMRAGMSREEAEKKTLASQVTQVASQAAGGFLSGLLFGSGGQITNAFEVGQDQGAKGIKAVGAGMQTISAYNAAEAEYKKAMKATPRYTSEERVAIARDIEESGLPASTKDGISKLIDQFAMQPQGWITERGQALTEQAIQATRQAAEKGSVATAQLEAKQTRALERLNTMFSDIQALYKSSESALQSGDLAAHTKAVEATTAAIAKYNSAHKTEQAELQAQKAQREAEQRAAAEAVSSSSRKLQAKLPAEVENHKQIIAQIEVQAAPAAAPAVSDNGSAAYANVPADSDNVSAVSVNDVAEMANENPAATVDAPVERSIQNGESAQAGAPAEVMRTIDELRGVASLGKYDEILAKHGMSSRNLMRNPVETYVLREEDGGSRYSILSFIYRNQDVKTETVHYEKTSQIPARDKTFERIDGWLIPNAQDPNYSSMETLSKFYDMSRVDPNSDAPIRIISPARMTNRPMDGGQIDVETGEIVAPAESNMIDGFDYKKLNQSDAFYSLLEKGVMSNTGLTAQPTTGNVSAGKAAQAAQGTFDLVGSLMKNASGVPVYKQQTAPAKGNPSVDVIKSIVNGGNPNGKQGSGQNNVGELVSGQADARQGDRSGASGQNEAYALANGAADRSKGNNAARPGDSERGQGSGSRSQGNAGVFGLEARTGVDRGGRQGLRETKRIGADWKKINQRSLENHVAKFNQEIAESGSAIAPITAGDLTQIQDTDLVTASLLFDLSRFSGREVFLYVSNSGRTDLPGGFADGLHDYVRYTGEDTVVFHNAHETAENSRELRQAGYEALKLCPPDTLDRYAAMRAANSTDVAQKDKTKLKKEFVCDMYGALMYDVRLGTGGDIYKQLGVSADVITRFEDAFFAATDGKVLEETDLETAMDEVSIGTENSQFLIQGKSVDAYDPADEMALAAATELHKEGKTSMQYAGDPDSFDNVAGYMRGIERADYNARVVRTALDLFEQGETPETYWQKSPKAYDNAVGRQLLGIMQRNGQSAGGRLSQAELDWITRNALKFPQFSNPRLYLSSPARIMENLGRTRSEKTPENRMNNYKDGVQLRDAVFGFADHMNGVSSIYERDEHEKVARAYGKGTKRESALIDLFGQRYITEDDAKSAVFDDKHMIVPSQNALYVFGGAALSLISDDQQTILFDQKYRDAVRAKNEELRKALTTAKGQNEHKRIIEKFQADLKRVPKVVIEGKTRVVVKGKTQEVYLPDGTLYARVSNGKHANMKIVKDTTTALKDYYARAYQEQNLALVSNGYPAMGQIADYFPHRLPETGTLKGFTKFITSEDLPTWINGTTATRKPGRPYTSHVLERMGTYTNFDAIANFNVYLPSASDLIHMTPVIQRIRQFERELRQLSKFESENGTQGARNANSSLAVFLLDYGNLFANKKPLIDRGAEIMFGRKFYKVQDFVTNMYGASAVAGNVSVALSNVIAGFEAIPTLNKALLVKNFAITIGQGLRLAGDNVTNRLDAHYDGFADEIPFLASRRNDLKAILSKDESWQHIKRGFTALTSSLFNILDYLSTETVARTKFDMLMREGMTRAEASNETSAYCHKLFASRATGMSPMMFKSRMMRPFLQFLLEPVNQMGHIRDIAWETRRDAVQDIERMIREANPNLNVDEEIRKAFQGSGWKDLAKILMYLICTSLYNMLISRPLKGRDSTINAFGLGYDFLYDLKQDGFKKAAGNAGMTLLDQSVFGGFVGGGRIPVGGILENAKELAQEMADEDSTPEDRWKKFWKNLYGVVPTGGQISKTVRGREANKKGGSYTESGKLRYPVTEADFWRTIVFGPSAAEPYAYDYLTDTLSESKTEAYEQLVKDGMEPYQAYYLLQGYDTSNNASKALSILTADYTGGHISTIDRIMGVRSKPDGKPDFTKDEAGNIATALGIKYDTKEDGPLDQWAKKAADDYIEKATKDGAVTADEKKKIDNIKRMMQLMLGMD